MYAVTVWSHSAEGTIAFLVPERYLNSFTQKIMADKVYGEFDVMYLNSTKYGDFDDSNLLMAYPM